MRARKQCPVCGRATPSQGLRAHLEAHGKSPEEAKRLSKKTPLLPGKRPDAARAGRRLGEIRAGLSAIDAEEKQLRGKPENDPQVERLRGWRAALEAERAKLLGGGDPSESPAAE